MNDPTIDIHRQLFKRLIRAFGLAFLLLPVTQAGAQTATDGMTPSGLAPGAAAGAYSLSGLDNVNLYNGNLNFSAPLLGIGGRGGAQTQTRLTLDSVRWVVEGNDVDGYSVNPNWWEGIRPGYGPGVLQARAALRRAVVTHLINGALTRLTFTAPDGTEYELVDTYHGGQYYTSCTTNTQSRGQVFVSHDSSAFITFVSNSTIYDRCTEVEVYSTGLSGYLYFPDGTRYEISDGLVTKSRDRNGNLISFSYDGNKRVTGITDSLNRQVTVSYADMISVFYDQITYKGFGGTQRALKVWHTSLSNALRSGYNIQTYGQLFPYVNPWETTTYNPSSVVSAVELPDGRQYQFKYNPYGELARLVLPSGGAIEYDYVEMSTSAPVSNRRVSERRVYGDGTNLESKQVYSASSDGTNTTTVVENRDASNNLLAKSQHYFNGDGIASIRAGWSSMFSYAQWQEGKEFKSESLAADGATVLRRVENTWEQGTTVTSWLASVNAANNPRVNQTVSTLVDTNQVAKETFSFDSYNNTTDVYEYDYDSGIAGSLVRHSHTDFMTTNPVNGTDYTSSSNNLYFYRLPSQTSIYDASNVERARTSFEYDNYGTSAGHAGLVNRSNISGLDSGFMTSYGTRANVTATTHYLLNSSGSVTGSITTYEQYDIAGNVTTAIDARGNPTTFGYADCFGAPNGNARTNTAPSELSAPGLSSFAMLTSVTNALGQTVYAQYDYYLGRSVDGEDINGVVASGYFDDVLDRPTKVIHDYNNLAAKSKIEFSYDDTNHIVTTKSDFASYDDKLIRKDALYDGLGRTTETRVYETSTAYVTTKQIYDALGRTSQVSNPYRSGETIYWTTTAYDALSRVTSVTTPDSAVASTSYSGNTVTVTDQAGKSRKSVTDALGRLTAVYEDPSGLNYQTTYSYDVLDDLTQVSQGSQTRTFAFDSLKRLTSTTNPENGTVTIDAFDNNGNVLVSTDARGVSTHVAYDGLNRPTRRWYNSSNSTSSTTNNSPPLPSGVAATNEVAYFYDAQPLPNGAPSFTRGYSTGRVVAVTYGGGSAGTYTGFDALGRTLRKIQQTDSVDYMVEASYNVSGAMTSETYPSVPGASDRRVVNYSFDPAGRLSSLSSSATSYAPAASVSSITYASHGALSSETYGNGLIQATTYNTRLQVGEIKLGTSGNSTSVLDLTYNRGTTANNGNIQSVSYSGGGLAYMQSFGYDALNRLSSATETTDQTNWSQTNAYDRYGNRTIDLSGGEVVWVDDALPAGATAASDGGDSWTWGSTNPSPYSGTVSHQSNIAAGEHQHYFYGTTQTLQVNPGDRLYAYVYLDPANMPSEVMLQWFSNDTGWVRAYWGANNISWGTDGTETRRHMWSLPAAGGWVRLEVPASAVGLEGKTINGMAFTLYDGRATWDKAGKVGSLYGAGPPINNSVYTVDATTNRLTSVNGVTISYDSSGNLTNDGAHSYSFDAEDKILVVDSITAYTYNGSGQRVRKLVGENTRFVYGIAGELIMEFDGSSGDLKKEYVSNGITIEPTAVNSHGTQYGTADHLGTARVITDSSGSVVSRHDYAPFGEEIGAGTGGRTTGMGYGSTGENNRKKFTGYERDSETGLDFAQARYNSSTMGRFTSPDPYSGSMSASHPQSFNRYAYVGNNPVNATDPTGLSAAFPRAGDALGRVNPGGGMDPEGGTEPSPANHPDGTQQAALNRLNKYAKQADKEGNSALASALRAVSKELASAIAALRPGEQRVGINVAVNAILNVGNTMFADASTTVVSKSITIRGSKEHPTSKCNVLVAFAHGIGAGLHFIANGSHGRGYPLTKGGVPPAANYLGDKNDTQHLTNIPVIKDGILHLQIGDIIAWRYSGGSHDGHSAIYIGGGVVIYAGGPSVHGWPAGTPQVQTLSYVNSRLTTWPYEWSTGAHEPAVVRRYSGR
jgi:RHS repeat-associated protein